VFMGAFFKCFTRIQKLNGERILVSGLKKSFCHLFDTWWVLHGKMIMIRTDCVI
jgi:hypothetical protein